MDERMDSMKGRRQKAPQHIQKTKRRNRNQTPSQHQKPKTTSMNSETADERLLVKQISPSLS